MKKILLFTLILISTAACVDQDYDLSKIDTDNIVIGNEFKVPLGSYDLKIADIWESIPSDGDEIEVTIPNEFKDELALSDGFDKSILDALTEGSEQSINLAIASDLKGVEFNASVSMVYIDPETNKEVEISLLKDQIIGDNETKLEIPISGEELKNIVKSAKIIYNFETIKGAGEKMTINKDTSIKFTKSVNIKGGLKL